MESGNSGCPTHSTQSRRWWNGQPACRVAGAGMAAPDRHPEHARTCEPLLRKPPSPHMQMPLLRSRRIVIIP